jgi:hypothetical protein
LEKKKTIMNTYENFGPMGGGPRPMARPMGRGGVPGSGPRPMARPMGRPMGRDGMKYHHRSYHHPKPRYHYNHYPYYYYNNYFPYSSYFYPYNYYYPVVSSIDDQDICFCTDPKYDNPDTEKICVEGICGVCIPRSTCTTCDEKITCKKQD